MFSSPYSYRVYKYTRPKISRRVIEKSHSMCAVFVIRAFCSVHVVPKSEWKTKRKKTNKKNIHCLGGFVATQSETRTAFLKIQRRGPNYTFCFSLRGGRATGEQTHGPVVVILLKIYTPSGGIPCVFKKFYLPWPQFSCAA